MNQLSASVSDTGAAACLWRSLAHRLEQAGIDTALLDAEILLRHVMGWNREDLFRFPEARLDSCQRRRLVEMGEARSFGTPIARLVGYKEFWSLDFLVSDETLIPRPESETLVSVALDGFATDAPLRILDLGCGCGCLLLALLWERRRASGVGIDLSARAVATARHNAVRFGLGETAHFETGDWGEGIAVRFDLLVSNPPYIRSGEIDSLQREVRLHDPHLALDGGENGMDKLRIVIAAAPQLLHRSGRLIVEVGAGQAEAVAGCMVEQGFRDVRSHRDLARVERVVAGVAPA